MGMKLEFLCCNGNKPIINSKNVSEIMNQVSSHNIFSCGIWKAIAEFFNNCKWH